MLDGLEFTAGYNDSTSVEYNHLKQEFCQKVSDVLQGGILNRWYKACEVTGFSRGSVIVHYELTVVRPTVGQVSHTLQHLIVSGLEEELRRPNSLLAAFSVSLNASLSFGPLANSTGVTTTQGTPATTVVSDASTYPDDTTTDTRRKIRDGRYATEDTRRKIRDGRYATEDTRRKIRDGRYATEDTRRKIRDGRYATEDTRPKIRDGRYATEGTRRKIRDGRYATEGVDPCAGGPCENGGTCTREDDGYRCDCPVCGCSQGGTTSTCGLAADICVNKTRSLSHPYDCHKYVMCPSSTPQGQACSGDLVFNPDSGVCSFLTDTACAQPIVTGDSTQAPTGGTSTPGDVDPCASGPCENGGTCTREDDGYRCDCPVCGCSQGGTTSTCGLGGLVYNPIEVGVTYVADTACAQPVVPVSTTVTVVTTAGIDECASSPCQHASTCIDHVAGYTCLCGHNCGCANQASGPNCEKDPVTCDGFIHGDFIPDPDNCALSHQCLGQVGPVQRYPSGIANCTSDRVFVPEFSACLAVEQAMCANYTFFHVQP
ncbi:hypothetical protein NP493_22g06004 [Ridgeia piscesae]|uniref:Chitin-binding type-2 domain-containing protein n=1 Tax=Ridgeia piscesae TaxID=27915 RepID=A0AAD9PDG8_RIDPI|nr:hypothetical protein NP493_22g06004 [Ridgeia piscesae]